MGDTKVGSHMKAVKQYEVKPGLRGRCCGNKFASGSLVALAQEVSQSDPHSSYKLVRRAGEVGSAVKGLCPQPKI